MTTPPSHDAVQSHLSMQANVIQRMAGNSASMKTWCITLVSAVIVLAAQTNHALVAWVAIGPIFLFAALDAYYLALERMFRASYNQFIDRLHTGTLAPADLYAFRPNGKIASCWLKAHGSISVWPFYAGIAALVGFALIATSHQAPSLQPNAPAATTITQTAPIAPAPTP